MTYSVVVVATVEVDVVCISVPDAWIPSTGAWFPSAGAWFPSPKIWFCPPEKLSTKDDIPLSPFISLKEFQLPPLEPNAALKTTCPENIPGTWAD